MMTRIFLLSAIILTSCVSHAQSRYFSKAGKISFYSKAPMENIEAHNNKAVSVVDVSTGQVEFSVLLKGFEFQKARMQEHFNENYVESDKYPKSVFTGSIKNPGDIKLDKDGVYNVKVSGQLTLHGVTKPQDVDASFTVQNGRISAVAEFVVTVADYNIKIPALVKDNIGKTVKIVVNVPSYQPMGTGS
jgi:polyisoprenoid-binding protein YceI